MIDKGEVKPFDQTSENEKPFSEYPYVPGKYGLDLSKIKSGFIGEIQTGSGRKVMGDFGQVGDKAWVRIDDKKDNYIMHLNVKGDTAIGDINTRKKNGERQPDFFAKEFLLFALNHLEENGHPVRKIKSKWLDTRTEEWDSDNFTQYWLQRGESIDPIEAARNTWSGEIFGRLGFTEIEKPVEGSEGVVVVFRKPDIDPIILIPEE